MSRYLWFSAFAICGIAFYVWIETWAHYNREKLEELLAESEKSRIEVEAEQVVKTAWDNGSKSPDTHTHAPDSYT